MEKSQPIYHLSQKETPLSEKNFFESDFFTKEETMFIQKYLKSYQIPLKTENHTYTLNCRYFESPINSIKTPAFMLHGHSSISTWARWIQLAIQLFKMGHNVLLMDLPSYGKSVIDSKKRSNPKLYIHDSHNLVIGVLDAFGFKKVHAVGQCGGAANFVRTMIKFPHRFAQTHIFSNAVMSSVPEELEEVAQKYKWKIWVVWRVDQDHSSKCVAYKWYDNKRKNGSSIFELEDVYDKDLKPTKLKALNMGRNTDTVLISDFSQGFIDKSIAFLRGEFIKLGQSRRMDSDEEILYRSILEEDCGVNMVEEVKDQIEKQIKE